MFPINREESKYNAKITYDIRYPKWDPKIQIDDLKAQYKQITI